MKLKSSNTKNKDLIQSYYYKSELTHTICFHAQRIHQCWY